MDLLPFFGVSCELSKNEFVRRLECDSLVDNVRDLRNSLFLDAVKRNLAGPGHGDVLVTRKKSGIKTVKEKHIDDIWTLAGAINRCECVLLKNGKRG